MEPKKQLSTTFFVFNVALYIVEDSEDLEPKSVKEGRHRNGWPKWKDAIWPELNSIARREVFGLVVQTPEGIELVRYKWVFV